MGGVTTLEEGLSKDSFVEIVPLGEKTRLILLAISFGSYFNAWLVFREDAVLRNCPYVERPPFEEYSICLLRGVLY